MPRKTPSSASRGGPSKAQFIRGLNDLTAAEVVARGKEAGVELSEQYVYNVRSSDKSPGSGPGRRRRGADSSAESEGGSEAEATNDAGEADAGRRRPRTSSKREFVASMPAEMPAAEVVLEAEKRGIALTTGYVYVLRSQSRRGGAPALSRGETRPRGAARRLPSSVGPPNDAERDARREGSGRTGRASARPSSSDGSAGLEADFRRLVIELGLERAQRLLDGVRAQLERLIAGH